MQYLFFHRSFAYRNKNELIVEDTKVRFKNRDNSYWILPFLLVSLFVLLCFCSFFVFVFVFFFALLLLSFSVIYWLRHIIFHHNAQLYNNNHSFLKLHVSRLLSEWLRAPCLFLCISENIKWLHWLQLELVFCSTSWLIIN